MSEAERLLTPNWAECSKHAGTSTAAQHYSVGFKPATRVVGKEEEASVGVLLVADVRRGNAEARVNPVSGHIPKVPADLWQTLFGLGGW